METKLGIAKIKILKSGRHIHIQNFSKYPPISLQYVRLFFLINPANKMGVAQPVTLLWFSNISFVYF